MTAAMLVLLPVGLWFMTQLRIWRIHPARGRRSARRDLVDDLSLEARVDYFLHVAVATHSHVGSP